MPFRPWRNASRWTEDSYAYAYELLKKAGVGVASGVDFGQAKVGWDRLSNSPSEESTPKSRDDPPQRLLTRTCW